MLIVVDGSGAFFSNSYMQQNAGSFCWQLFTESSQAPKRYFRGPSRFGTSSYDQALDVVCLLEKWVREYPEQRVFLAGHSRGGAICIQAARWLQGMNISVDCLVLFDAVQMVGPIQQFLAFNTAEIPDNVKDVLHPMRSPELGSRSHWWNAGRPGGWGNAGLHWKGHPEYNPALQSMFYTTHAGVGGTPWTGDHPQKPYRYLRQPSGHPEFDVNVYGTYHSVPVVPGFGEAEKRRTRLYQQPSRAGYGRASKHGGSCSGLIRTALGGVGHRRRIR